MTHNEKAKAWAAMGHVKLDSGLRAYLTEIDVPLVGDERPMTRAERRRILKNERRTLAMAAERSGGA